MNCKKATYLHEKMKDGEITLTERLGVWFHLLYCSLCKMFIRQVEQLEKSSKTLTNSNLSLSPSSKENMQKSFEKHIKG